MYPNGSGHGGPQHRPDGHVRECAGRAGGVQEGDRHDHGQAAVAVAERGGERAAQEQDAQHEEVSAMLKNKMRMLKQEVIAARLGVFPDFAGEAQGYWGGKKNSRTRSIVR